MVKIKQQDGNYQVYADNFGDHRCLIISYWKAKELYNKGGALREIALMAFTEDELQYNGDLSPSEKYRIRF